MERSYLEACLVRGMTQRQIALDARCSQTTVRYWLKRFDLESSRARRAHEPEALLPQLIPLPAPPSRPGRDTNAIGATTEATVLAVLTAAGYPCYIPFTVGKADLVMETADGLRTVQCKTGVLVRDGEVLRFRSRSNPGNGTGTNYRGIVDYFAVAAPERPFEVYLVPVDAVGVEQVHLRLKAPRNGQRRGVHLASDYQVIPISHAVVAQ